MDMRIGARLGIAALLGLALSGCVDATMDVEVLTVTTARATMTQVMDPQFYAMSKLGMAAAGQTQPQGETAIKSDFCENGQLTETPDGGATCVIVKEGVFAELDITDEENSDTTFTLVGPGLVRVGFPTGGLRSQIGADEATDAETKQMMQAFFAGHAITYRVRGNAIVETNMTRAEDGKSAERVVPFVDVINGTAGLPEELYVVVRIN